MINNTINDMKKLSTNIYTCIVNNEVKVYTNEEYKKLRFNVALKNMLHWAKIKY